MYFNGEFKQDLLALLGSFAQAHNWEGAASCADYIMEHYGEDFEVACALQHAAIQLSLAAAQGVIAATSLLRQRVAENLEATTRVSLANELVRKLDPLKASSSGAQTSASS